LRVGDDVVRQATHTLEVPTDGQGLFDITSEVCRFVAGEHLSTGLLTAFISHTSASLVISENADPDVQRDMVSGFRDLAPRDRPWRHDSEGADDMPAHIRCALTGVQLSIPVVDGRPVLGTWQGIYVFEHRDRPHRRRVTLHLLGE